MYSLLHCSLFCFICILCVHRLVESSINEYPAPVIILHFCIEYPGAMQHIYQLLHHVISLIFFSVLSVSNA